MYTSVILNILYIPVKYISCDTCLTKSRNEAELIHVLSSFCYAYFYILLNVLKIRVSASGSHRADGTGIGGVPSRIHAVPLRTFKIDSLLDLGGCNQVCNGRTTTGKRLIYQSQSPFRVWMKTNDCIRELKCSVLKPRQPTSPPTDAWRLITTTTQDA